MSSPLPRARIPRLAVVAAGLDDGAHPAHVHANRCYRGAGRVGRGSFVEYEGTRVDMLAILYYVEAAPPFEPLRETGCDPKEHRALHKAAAALRSALGLDPTAAVPTPDRKV